jgi:hypothetical protein
MVFFLRLLNKELNLYSIPSLGAKAGDCDNCNCLLIKKNPDKELMK